MNRKGIQKRILSVILTAVLVFSGTDYGNLSDVYAREDDTWDESQNKLTEITLPAEGESAPAADETETTTEHTNAAEETANATEEDGTDTESADAVAIEKGMDATVDSTTAEDETAEDEIRAVASGEEEFGAEKALAAETNETEAETDEEIAVNAESGTCGDSLNWNYDSTSKTLTISGTGEMTDYGSDNTPGSLTAPWKGADCAECEKVIIEEGVTSIGTYAFLMCKFKTVSIPSSIKSIGNWAFKECTALEKIILPQNASLESIGESAFESCSSLQDITISCPVSVGVNAFKGCSSLGTAKINYSSNSSVKTSTFENCKNLTTVELDGNFSTIENRAFSSCSNLTTIKIPDGSPSIADSSDGTENGPGPFVGCGKLTKIDATNGLGNIGKYAFYKRDMLTSIKLSDKATTIGSYAFAYCTALNSIEIPQSITSIDESAFEACSNLASITFNPRDNQNNLAIGNYAFYKNAAETLTIPDNTTVAASAFSTQAGSGKLKKIVIGNNVTLNNNAFNFQSNLAEVVFEKSITINDAPFANCNSQVLMKLYKGSNAHTYAKNKNFNYKYRIEQVKFAPDPDNKDPREIEAGKTAELEIKLLPDNSDANNDGTTTIADKIEWQSSNPDIVSIDSNAPASAENSASVTVHAHKKGTSTITVTCDGKTAACTVKVMVPAEPVTASPESGSVIYSNSDDNNTVALSCATTDAVIYYTTDGSNPTKDSNKYDVPISFDGKKSSVTIKAFATAEGYLDSEVSTFTYTVKKKAEGIELSASSLTLGIEESRDLSIHFTPEGAEAATTPVTWQSSDADIASVTSDSDTTKAKITAKKAGTCTITATCGSFPSVTCNVTVNSNPRVSQVTAEPDSGEVTAGTKVTLHCDTPDAKIYYTTDGSNPTTQSTAYADAVTVSSEMTIKAVAVKSGYDDSEIASFTYTIKEETIEITGISLDKDELKLGAGQKDTLTARFQPENALPEEITWTSGNPSIAQVQANAADDTTAEVTGVKAGTCTITASCGNHTATCTVIVTEKECVSAVRAEPGAGAVKAGTEVSLLCDTEGADIYYTLDGTTPTTQSSLYNEPIAIEKAVTIKAIAVKEGYENSAVAAFSYTIAKDEEISITGISLDKTELKLEIGKPDSLTVRFQPEDASPKNVVWNSDNKEIADVTPDDNGTTAAVTGKKAGTCTITAACGTYKATCSVTVTAEGDDTKRVSEVKAEPGPGAVKTGTKVTLTCETEDAKIYYTTDDTTPTTQSSLYGEPITIEKAVTIKAIAMKEGYEDSAVAAFAYTIANDAETAITGILLDKASIELGLEETGRLTVSFQPADAAPQTVTWNSDNPEIADVSADTDNSASAKIVGKKAGQCTVTASCLTFTASCTVTVTGEKRVSTVYATPSAESAVTPGTTVQLHCDTTGAVIYYTLDGTVPTTAGTRYTSAIVLNEDTTIKAVAVKEGYTDSPVAVFEYTVNNIVPDLPDIDPSKEGIWVTPVADQPYTGSAVKPAVYVYDGKKLLTEKTDYTVSYKNNKNPGDGQIIITGKGNYTDKKTVTFKITPRNISDTDVIIEDMAYAYNGKVHKTAPAITHNGKKLKLNRDFEVTYGEGGYIEEGRYELTIKGIGNYTGTANGAISIIGKDKLLNKAAVAAIPSQQYNKGTAVTLPDSLIKVTLNKQALQKDKDYTVSYANNVNPGKATVIIRGKGDYAGTKKATFKIVRTAVNMNDVTCTNSESFREMEFVKGGCTPYPVLTYDGYTLRAGTDYTISYKNNKKAGATAKIVVSGKGNFKGKREFGFAVRQKDISKVSMYTPNVPYTGKKNKYQSKPILTDSDGTRLKVNTDYTLTFMDGDTALDKQSNPDEGTIITVQVKGKGSYTGERTDTYVLSGISFSGAKIQIKNKDYTGRAITLSKEDIQSATIKVAGTTSQLIYGEDYEVVSYSKNVKKGTATAVLCGKGKYCGEKSVKFKIVSRNIKSDK